MVDVSPRFTNKKYTSIVEGRWFSNNVVRSLICGIRYVGGLGDGDGHYTSVSLEWTHCAIDSAGWSDVEVTGRNFGANSVYINTAIQTPNLFPHSILPSKRTTKSMPVKLPCLGEPVHQDSRMKKSMSIAEDRSEVGSELMVYQV